MNIQWTIRVCFQVKHFSGVFFKKSDFATFWYDENLLTTFLLQCRFYALKTYDFFNEYEQNFTSIPSSPKFGCLNMYMDCMTAGSLYPSSWTSFLSLSEKVKFLNSGIYQCRACPILFKAKCLSTYNIFWAYSMVYRTFSSKIYSRKITVAPKSLWETATRKYVLEKLNYKNIRNVKQ